MEVVNRVMRARSISAIDAGSGLSLGEKKKPRNVTFTGESFLLAVLMVCYYDNTCSRYLNSSVGEKLRVYNCCSQPMSKSEGCARGPHVFYEAECDKLHIRHPFSASRSPFVSHESYSADTALDIVALDCEMIYTTGGMSVARVSVVDGSGLAIFDEYVDLDDGVEIMSVSLYLLNFTR